MPSVRVPQRAKAPDTAPERRPWASSASTLVLLVTLMVGLGSRGSFYPDAQPRLAVGVALALALALLAGTPSRALAGPVGAAFLLGCWAVADGALHGDAAAGLPTAAVAIGVAAVLLTVGCLSSGDRTLVADALPLIGGLIAASAWIGLLARSPDWALVANGMWRASGALGYPNATAAVLVPLALLTIARARATTGARWAGAGLATAMLTTSTATLSRGGLLALAAGLVALLALGDGSVRRAAAGSLAGSALATATLLPSLPVTAEANVPLAAAGLAAGILAAGVLSAGVPGGRLLPADRRIPGAGVLGGRVTLAAVVSALLLAVLAVGPIARTGLAIAADRFREGSAHRLDAAAAALRELRTHPLTGVGPGQSQVQWHNAAGASVTLHFVHDEYLQVLLELGAVGAVLLALLLLAAARSIRRARPEWTATPLQRATWAGAASACMAFAVHSAFDFLWHLPALPMLAAVLLALAATQSPAHAPVAGSDGPEPPVASL